MVEKFRNFFYFEKKEKMKRLLGLIFGKNRPETKIESSQRFSIPEEDIRLKFLKRIKGMDINFDFDCLGYKEHLGSSKKIIEDFFKNDLIRCSEYLETLNLPVIKNILRENGFSISGNKADLILRIKKEINSEKYLKKNFRKYFVLTPKGKSILNDYELKFESDFKKFANEVCDLIVSDNLELAKKLVLSFNQNKRVKSGFFLDESENFLTRRNMRVSYFYNSPQFLSDLNLNTNELKILGKYFSCYSLFKDNVLEFDLIGRIENEFPNIKPKQIFDFLESNPFGKFSKKDYRSLRDVIEVFIEYEYYYADNKVRIAEILENEFKERWDGIQILNGGCERCKDLKLEAVTFQDFKKISVLPKYPGCQCLYSFYRA